VALRVAPYYLRPACGVWREAHGSVDGYLEAALGVTPALRDRIAARILG
jgi:protein tyrosine/serine phosphatase